MYNLKLNKTMPCTNGGRVNSLNDVSYFFYFLGYLSYDEGL